MPYQFGTFTLDEHVFELRKDREAIPLRRQAFDALHYLISNRERLVPKEELFGAIWPGTTVTENALAQCITDIRRAVGDSGRSQRIIKTGHGRGFQFVAAVKAAILPFPGWSQPLDRPEDARPDAVAVLAFDPFSGDPHESQFGKGVAEDLVRCLATWRVFPVISATSTWNYRREKRELPQVGRELGCAYLVEGSIQSSASRVRVRVHVSDTARGTELWAERFDVPLRDLFALQDEIAGSIAIAIYPELLRCAMQRAMRRAPTNLDAWQLSLRGLAHFFREQRDENRLAIAEFQRALEQDPTSLLPLFHLGYAHHLNQLYQWTPDQSAELARVAWAAEQCLRIDPSDPSGHMLSGMVQIAQGQSERALAYLRTAVDANPSLAQAQALYGQILAIRGYAEDSVRHTQLAMRLSPRDPRPGKFHSGLAMAHFVAHRYDEAMHAAERAILLNPEVLSNHICVAACAGQLGMRERAQEAAAEIQRLSPRFTDAPFRQILASSPDDIQQSFAKGLEKAGVIRGRRK
jgi:TolB-like protein/cytochrome c-type biogenesis protein CcmH/NrfG